MKYLYIIIIFLSSISSFSQSKLSSLIIASAEIINQSTFLKEDKIFLSIQGFDDIINITNSNRFVVVEQLSKDKAKETFAETKTVIVVKSFKINSNQSATIILEIQSWKYYGKKHKGLVLLYSIAIDKFISLDLIYNTNKWNKISNIGNGTD
jgi:hypothetical protein